MAENHQNHVNPDYEPNWNCIVCDRKPISPLFLEYQCKVLENTCVYADVNGDLYVKCSECLCPFHVRCIDDNPKDLESYACYLCDFLKCEETVMFRALRGTKKRKTAIMKKL